MASEVDACMLRLYIAHALPRHNQSGFLVFALVISMLVFPVAPAASQKPSRQPAATSLSALVAIVEQAIAADEIPGAVLLVGHQGRVVFHRAYGLRAVLPAPEPMTADTIFDLASLKIGRAHV